MRNVARFALLVVALSVVRLVGCGDESPCGDCNDGNPCTRDVCDSYNTSGTISCDPEDISYRCEHPRVSDGTPCGSGNICVSGVCRENLCADCEDDRNSCTTDCDYSTGACEYVALPDWSACKGDQYPGICQSGVCIVCEENDCDDGNLCTNDWCNLDYGGCLHEDVYCPEESQCAPGVCDPATGECSNPSRDGDWCWGNYVWGWLALCEGDVCVGQCDVESIEMYPCPVNPPASDEATYVCCPWDNYELRRPHCIEERFCEVERIERKCESECPDTLANPTRTDDCVNYTKGDCELVDYCLEECGSTKWECMTTGDCS